MSKDNPKKRRKSVALHPPFTRKQLIKWADSLPSDAQVRLVTVTPQDKTDVKSHLQALYWESIS